MTLANCPGWPDGRSGLVDPIFITKEITILAGASSALSWSATDNGGIIYIYPALSCNLPPGVGIRQTNRTYDEDIGA